MTVVTTGTIEDVLKVQAGIPELEEGYSREEYQQRLENTPHLILVAYVVGRLAGFKVGYDRYQDESLYSWMGGVKTLYRRMGIAQDLARQQEQWAREQGYTNIVLKTRNCYKPMLMFTLSNGFNIVDFEEKKDPLDNRIILKKEL